MTRERLGEFEQMVLLAILQCRDHANGYEIRQELEASANRSGVYRHAMDRYRSRHVSSSPRSCTSSALPRAISLRI